MPGLTAENDGKMRFWAYFLRKDTRLSECHDQKRVELILGGVDSILFTSLRTVWKLLRASWCPHPQASLKEEIIERVKLSPG